MGLSKAQLDRYQRDGIVFPVDVFSEKEVAAFSAELQSIGQSCGNGTLKRYDNLHLFFDWAYRLVTSDALLDSVEGILGEDLLIDGTLVFYKPPRDLSYASWHQDSVYSGWHLTPSVSAWIALTPSHRGNGGMRVIPGSHKDGLLAHVNIEDPNLLNRRGEQIDVEVDETKAVNVELRPGQMSLHHSTLVHGSNPNTSDDPRAGFIVRFVTNRLAKSERPVMRVRGAADCSHLNLARPPLGMDRGASLASWQSFNADRATPSQPG